MAKQSNNPNVDSYFGDEYVDEVMSISELEALEDTSDEDISIYDDEILRKVFKKNEDDDYDGFVLYKRMNFNAAKLSDAEELELVKKAAEGDKSAKDKLVVVNYGITLKVAKRYQGHGMELEDMMQEGVFGLMMTVDKFDPNRGTKFSTYAEYWVRQVIGRAVANFGRQVYLPSDKIGMLYRIKRETEKFTVLNGREPDLKELVKATGFKKKDIEELLSVPEPSMSIDMEIGKEDGTTYGDQAEDIFNESYENITEKVASRQEIHRLLGALDNIECRIITLAWGLSGGTPHEPEEIAKMVGMKTRTVKEIEKQAIKKLEQMKDDGLSG